MRLFAGDIIPNLRMVAQTLPSPWVLPNGINRTHRARLVKLLHLALQGAQPDLRLVDIPWGKRTFIERGTLILPQSVLVCWRVAPLPSVDRARILLEGRHLGSRLSVFDFGHIHGDEHLAWLGPLKTTVLHCLIDVFTDNPPVKEAQDIVERLRNLARFVRSPIDLIEAADTMVAMLARGQSVRNGHAQACARLISMRFDDEDRERDAGDMIRALTQVAFDTEQLTPQSRTLLEHIGLVEHSSGRPLPLVDLLREHDVMPRTQRLLIARFPLRETIPELMLSGTGPVRMAQVRVDSFVENKTMGNRVMHGLDTKPEPGDGFDTLDAKPSSALRAAALRWRRGDHRGAARLVLDDIRNGRTNDWSHDEWRVAGGLLLLATRRVYDTLPDDSPMLTVLQVWLQAGIDALERTEKTRQLTQALGLAGMIALDMGEPARANEALTRSVSLAQRIGDQRALAHSYLLLGRAMLELEDYDESQDKYQRALSIAEDLDDRQTQAGIHLYLGELHLARDEDSDASRSFEVAYDIWRDLEDNEMQAAALMSLAVIQTEQLDTDAAIANVTKALELAPPTDEPFQVSALIQLGTLRAYKDDWTGARRELERARQLVLSSDEPTHHDVVFNAIGTLELEMDNIETALSMFGAALSASRLSGDIENQAHALNGMGAALRLRGDVDDAWQAHNEALDIAESDAPFQHIQALLSLGEMTIWRNGLDDPDPSYFKEALHLSRRERLLVQEIWSLLGIASILIARKLPAQTELEQCSNLVEDGQYRLLREYCRILQAATVWPIEPDAAQAEWQTAARYFHDSKRMPKAALVDAILALGAQPLHDIATKLEETLGTTHPLPAWIRTAKNISTALHAMILFTTV